MFFKVKINSPTGESLTLYTGPGNNFLDYNSNEPFCAFQVINPCRTKTWLPITMTELEIDVSSVKIFDKNSVELERTFAGLGNGR